MRRFRKSRRRAAALALAPVAAAMTIAAASGAAVAAPGPDASLDADQSRVAPNDKVTLEGRFRRPAGGQPSGGGQAVAKGAAQPIRIQFRSLGADNWRDVRRGSTGPGGRFRERVSVGRSGRFRAVSSTGRSTAAKLVLVKSRTRARLGDDFAKVGEKVRVRGRVTPAGAGRRVTVRAAGRTVRTRTSASGRFSARVEADSVGTSAVRVRAARNKIALGSGDRAGRLSVLRPAVASYYGPGLYGNHLGCGGTLQPGTVGVANKSLPCGTKLTVAYRGRSVETKVIDRGPYVGGREFDLTAALKDKLHFGSTGTVYVSK